jgi:predicted ester cyclase
MTPEQNRSVSRRFYTEIFEKGNLNLAEELFTTDFINHDHSGPGPNGEWPRGTEGVRAVVKTYRGAFPNIRFTIDDIFAEGDKVVTRWTAHGTNTGLIMGMLQQLGFMPPR